MGIKLLSRKIKYHVTKKNVLLNNYYKYDLKFKLISIIFKEEKLKNLTPNKIKNKTKEK